MLTALDDTLLHQAPLPFEFVASSDHRFYDRYWFEAIAPDGSAGVLISMGRYPNMNVLDGFVTAQTEGRQYNVRFSRQLRPRRGGDQRRRSQRHARRATPCPAPRA